MKKRLYQGVILHHKPVGKKDVETEILGGVRTLLGLSVEDVKFELVRTIPMDIPVDEVEVIVRPF